MIRVLLADDQPMVRKGLRAMVDGDDISVIAEAGDGHQAVSLAAELRPDVVLMDIRMPEVDGLEATRRIAGDERLAGTKVIILTTFDLDDYVHDAKKAVADKVQLPPGYRLEWAGQYRYLERAKARLAIVVPLTLALIFLLLFFNSKSAVEALLVTPAAPHSAYNRGLVLSIKDSLALEVLPASGRLAVEVDGQVAAHLEPGDQVELRPRPAAAHVVRLGRTTFYERARRKLRLADSAEVPASLPGWADHRD